jgi:hypothetical protein
MSVYKVEMCEIKGETIEENLTCINLHFNNIMTNYYNNNLPKTDDEYNEMTEDLTEILDIAENQIKDIFIKFNITDNQRQLNEISSLRKIRRALLNNYTKNA